MFALKHTNVPQVFRQQACFICWRGTSGKAQGGCNTIGDFRFHWDQELLERVESESEGGNDQPRGKPRRKRPSKVGRLVVSSLCNLGLTCQQKRKRRNEDGESASTRSLFSVVGRVKSTRNGMALSLTRKDDGAE